MAARQLWKALIHFLEIFADLCIVSFYWLVCCLPIVTIGAASAALYSTIVKVIRRGHGTLSITYFTVFKENLKQGIAVSLIFSGCCVLLFVYNMLEKGVQFEAKYYIVYWAVVIVLSLIFAGTFTYVFPLLSRFKLKTWDLLWNAFSMSIGYPVKTLGLICLLVLCIFLVRRAPFLILIIPGTYSLLSSIIQEPVLEMHTADDPSASRPSTYNNNQDNLK